MIKRFELMEGEEILADEPIHWKNYLSSVLLITLCVFVGLVRNHLKAVSIINHVTGMTIIPPSMNGLVVVCEEIILFTAILLAMARAIRISYIHYYVTNKRIISTNGILNRQVTEMLLNKCEMVYMNQNAYERMYNCGDILCVSAGTSLFLDDVKNVMKFKQMLMKLISER